MCSANCGNTAFGATEISWADWLDDSDFTDSMLPAATPCRQSVP